MRRLLSSTLMAASLVGADAGLVRLPATVLASSGPSVAAAVNAQASIQAFAHPGIGVSRADLDTIKANINKEPWKSGYSALAGDSHSQLSYVMQGPFASVSRNPHVNRNQWMNDMQAAWNLSRMWYFTGNAAYAQKAHDILLAWATTQTSFTGMEANLDLGDFAQCYGGAADLLRSTWSDWTQADTDSMTSLFDIYWNAAGGNNRIAMGPGNKGALTLAACAAIAIFEEDQAKIDWVLNKFSTSTSAGLPNTLPNGEIGETGRDSGHWQNSIWCYAFIAESFWKQGIDLYSENNNRLLQIGEYYARFQLGVDTPYATMGTTDELYTTRWSVVWDYGRPAQNLLINHYVNRLGLSAPYMVKFRDSMSTDANSFMYERAVSDGSTATPLAPVVWPGTASVSTGLTSANIGSAPAGTSTSYAGGTWTIVGGGTETWTHGADGLRYVYKQVTGNATITARVTGVQLTAATAKAGVMLRDSLSPTAGSRAWVAVTANQKVEYYNHGWTEMYGGSNWEKDTYSLPSASYWVKVERLGTQVTTYTSVDGTSWATHSVGEYSNLGNTYYLGLYVSALSNTALNTATFTDVRITGGDGLVNPVPAAPLSVMGSPGNRRVPLRWLASSGATSYKVKRSITSGGPYTTIATVTGTDYTDVGLPNDVTYYYTVTALNAAGESGVALEDAVRPTAPMVNLAGTGSASASAQNAAPESSAQAFDGTTNTKWYSGGNSGTTAWLRYDFGAGQQRTLTQYAVSSANDVPDRDPKDWQFVGSNDGVTWTLLDTQSNQQFSERYQTRTFTLAAPATYRYYRLNILSIWGAAANSTQLSELQLLGPENAGPWFAVRPVVTSMTHSVASMSVLGADDAPETALTYTWSVKSKPAGAADPIFSANGTNAAKNATATFAAKGQYTLTVTAKDAAGLKASNDVDVNVISLAAVIDQSFDFATTPNTLRFTLSNAIAASAFSASSLTVTGLVSGAFAFAPTGYRYDSSANSVEFDLPTSIGDGDYRASLSAGNVLPAEVTFDFFSLTGDLNHDRTVSFADLLVLAAHYGQTGRSFAAGNADRDSVGNVNFADLLILAAHYGSSLSSEPTAAASASTVTSDTAARVGRIADEIL
ncbi:MAG: alginate lyase family protein [Tepidisphaeraceae bacterium]